MTTLYRINKYRTSRRNSIYVFAASAQDAIVRYAAMQYQSAVQQDGDGWRLGTRRGDGFAAVGPRLFVVAEPQWAA